MAFRKKYFSLILVFFFFGSNLLVGQISSEIIVIGNDIGFTTLNKKQLIAYAKGEKNFWLNGKKVVISLPSTKTDMAAIISEIIYKTNPVGMQKYWLSLVFQGRADPPVFISSEEETIKFIQNNKGSIGFINSKNKSLATNFLIEIKTD
jgi:hypothetical protein